MTRVVVVSFLSIVALVGCRAPAPTYAPYGPQTVPPPVTGSIGTPAPQPAPYYQGSSATTVAPQFGANNGWRAPSATLGTQPLVQSQPTVNPSLNSTTTLGTTVAPNANFTSSGGQTLNAPPVTNRATIGGNTLGQPPASTSLGTGSQSAQSQTWQSTGTPTGTPQLLQTGTPVGTPPNVNLAPTNTGQGGTPATQPAPASRWGQPPINSGAQVAPNGVPLNGMHVNDATIGYAQPATPWTGVKNWFYNTFGQPMYGQPAYGQQAYGQQAYGQPNYGGQPIYQSQVVPASGYSTVAPTPTPLPVRGTQQNTAPATTYPASTMGGVQNAPVAPAAPQWGSVPMASAGAATVRGNDDADGETKPLGFVTKSQASETPHEAELYGQHEDYQWLRGKLEFSVSGQQWKLRYIPLDAPEGRMDSFGGSVVLQGGDQLDGFQSGDHVLVKGRLIGRNSGQGGFAPLYEVQSVSKL